MSLRVPTSFVRCPESAPGKLKARLGERCVIIEDLVLHRWRQRSKESPGEIFDGCRLRPNTWRVIRAAMESGVALHDLMDRERLAGVIRAVRAQHPTLKPTQVDRLLVVMAFLRSRGVLEAVVQRERTVANPGLPDLVLWRRSPSRGVYGVQFVEVKVKRKSGRTELLSPGQKEELAFLSQIGLKARHVLMLER